MQTGPGADCAINIVSQRRPDHSTVGIIGARSERETNDGQFSWCEFGRRPTSVAYCRTERTSSTCVDDQPLPKLPFPFDDLHPITRLTPITNPNGIQIQLAVLPQYTLWTDRPTDRPTVKTDRQTDRQTHGIRA